MLRVTDTLMIPDDRLVETFVRASGPGGQNVNKVASAVELRFDVANAPELSDRVRRRALELAGRQATRAGEIVIQAGAFRTQAANRRDARRRLAELLAEAAKPPTFRRKSRVTPSQKRKRLDSKRKRSAVKQARGKVRE